VRHGLGGALLCIVAELLYIPGGCNLVKKGGAEAAPAQYRREGRGGAASMREEGFGSDLHSKPSAEEPNFYLIRLTKRKGSGGERRRAKQVSGKGEYAGEAQGENLGFLRTVDPFEPQAST